MRRYEVAARHSLERALDLAADDNSPKDWLSSYCTPSYVEMEGGLCLLMLGSPASAAQSCIRALEVWPIGFARDEAMCLLRLSLARLDMNEVEEACAVTSRAISLVRQAPSARALHMLRAVNRRVHPFRQAPYVRQLREELAVVA